MIGDYRHCVTFQNPGAVVPDGDGGFTQAWADLVPSIWYCSISPASPQDLERFAAGTVITQATHIVKGRYKAGVSSSTRMLFGGRVFSIVGTRNLEERSITMELLAVEMIAAEQVAP
jgi:head-tail adaptor